MPSLIRVSLLCTVAALVTAANGASADYEGGSGYGSPASDMEELEVSHDGYPSADPAPAGGATSSSVSADAPNYIVIEVDDGASQKVDGETVIVVQEPEPTAATEQAPPAPLAVVPVDQHRDVEPAEQEVVSHPKHDAGHKTEIWSPDTHSQNLHYVCPLHTPSSAPRGDATFSSPLLVAM